MDKKLRNIRPKRVLWMDIEMTGLSAQDDLILEAAAIVTDWDFNEIATFHGVVKNNKTPLKKRIAANGTFWDANPVTRDNLLTQNENGKSLGDIEAELLAFLDEHFEAGVPVLLGGNSIHVDRQFIINKWPSFNARLHYRMLDVSAWKVVFEGKYRQKYAKPDTHRALDDIRGSIAELKYYLAKFK